MSVTDSLSVIFRLKKRCDYRAAIDPRPPFKRPRCQNISKTRYCPEHTCHHGESGESVESIESVERDEPPVCTSVVERYIQGIHGTSPTKYCSTHTCRHSGCINYSLNRGFCDVHRCVADGCVNVARGSPFPSYCSQHSCHYNYKGTCRKPIEKGRFCYNHRCGHDDCSEKVHYSFRDKILSRYCVQHKCLMCRFWATEGDYCVDHVPAVNPVNPALRDHVPVLALMSKCACSYTIEFLKSNVRNLRIVYDTANPAESVAVYLLSCGLGLPDNNFIFDHMPWKTATLPVAVSRSWASSSSARQARYTVHFNCKDGKSPLDCVCGVDNDDDSRLISALKMHIHNMTCGNHTSWSMSRSHVAVNKALKWVR